MLQFIDNLSLNSGDKVECYYNSKKGLISVRSIDYGNDNYGRIVAYAEYIHLEDAEFSYMKGINRKVCRGKYAGILPVIPRTEQMVFHEETGFYTTANEQIKGAKYVVCYKNMVLAEKVIRIGAEKNESIY
ncbi:hypothetical protein [Bacillus sp. 1P06AnD]|uniref:hypothetical protein n=1 Tax=Bacillus sp. 1P06AnD TaxID=3132208 RepID=UPI0039A31698